MRALCFLILALAACSSTQPTGSDGGDAGCPPGPTELNGSPGTSFGVPADPVTAACPADYCWRCTVLDWPEGCNDMLCVKTKPLEQYPEQCRSLCDAGADGGGDASDANDSSDASEDAATTD
jgi:hypothetical protein